MRRFLNKLFRGSRTTSSTRGGRPAPRRVTLQVERLEERLALSTTPPYFQILNVPASVQAGSSLTVEVVERGIINNFAASPRPATSANLFLGAQGATLSLGTVSLSDGIGFATVKLPTYAETGTLSAIAGSITGYAPLTLTPGPLTHFVVSAPSQATVNSPFQVTVTAEDALGNTVTSDNQAPRLTVSSGIFAISPLSWSNGVGTATVTQYAAGSMTLTAAAGSVTGSASVSVVPAEATHFQVTLEGGGTQVASGGVAVVDIKALDANGNLVTNFNQVPTLTASYGFPVSLDDISWFNGEGFADVTLTAPGTTTLTATAGKVTGTSSSFTVAPASYPWWSGYTINPSSGVTAVGGTWAQPADSGPNNADCLIWVGIDGNGSGTVEQCGTKMTMVNGQAQYYAFYELFGDQTPSSQSPNPNPTGPDYYEQYISGTTFPVHPGDTISAEVSLVPGTTNSFRFNMTDKPANGGPLETFSLVQTTQYVTPSRTSAEWIVENDQFPQQPLANFGQVTFTGAWAETGPTLSHPATIGPITSFADAQAVDMVTPARNPYTLPTTVALTGGASTSNTPGYLEPAAGVSSSSFTVSYAQPVNRAALPVSTVPSAAKAGGSALGTNAAADALFALDARDNRLGSTAALDALFALDAPGHHRRQELLW
jgi:hypothetical protein